MIAYRTTRRHATDWTPAEDDVLLTYAGQRRLSALAKKLGRTPHALKCRLLRHGQKLRQAAQRAAGMSVQDVASALGVTKSHVHKWMRIGWLKTRRGYGVDRRYITIDPDDVLRFVRDCGALLKLAPDRDWAEDVAAARAALDARLIDTYALARALYVHPSHLRNLTLRHGLPAPCLRIGGPNPSYYDRAAVRAWRATHPAYRAGSPI